VLWLTIALPALADLTGPRGASRRARNVVFVATAAQVKSRPSTEGVATFSPVVLHAVGYRVRWLHNPAPTPPSGSSGPLLISQPRSRRHRSATAQLVSSPTPGTPSSPPGLPADRKSTRLNSS